ncbi:MAG: NAD(P)H-hydrate dehydratase [Candidatus Wildermuthbacteria bacterium]|nr:NAD(P)H-hydrate dehydratase [Candidatus Wildermuthbacteria bacterium]
MTKVTKDILKELYPARPPEVKKYDYGLMLVIGGGDFYTGSPALVSLAGFRAGVDMVRLIAPKRAADIIASFTPVLAAFPLEGPRLTQSHLASLISLTEGAKDVSHGKVSVVIGGGMGRSQETQDAIVEYLSNVNVPVVIDADAIHAVAGKPDVLKGKPFVITPNTYELQLLGARDLRQLGDEERVKEVMSAAANLGTTLLANLAKAKVDIISNGTDVLLNEAGSPYLSVGGAGDTMAGIAGALLARGVSPLQAAAGAAYINGKAGELAAKKFGESLIATDIIDFISDAIQ